MDIYKKLFEAKKEIGKISKDSTNPFFKSKYFDINALLEHVEPILTKNNLLILQPIINGKVCTRIFDIETNDSVESSVSLIGGIDPQKLGSEITYYRRYTLQSLLGLQAEDDDANASTQSKNENKTELPWLNEGEKFLEAVEYLKKNGKEKISVIKTKYKISKAMESKLLEAI